MMWWVGVSQLVVTIEEFTVDFFLSSDATLEKDRHHHTSETIEVLECQQTRRHACQGEHRGSETAEKREMHLSQHQLSRPGRAD